MYNYQCNICSYKTGWMEELAAAIGTEQKTGEKSLPFRFCGAAFVLSQFLYSVKLCL